MDHGKDYISSLPQDILLMILEKLLHNDCMKFRLLSQGICDRVTPYCYRKINIEVSTKGLGNVANIAFHKQLRHHVKRLVFQRLMRIQDFPGVKIWRACVNSCFIGGTLANCEFEGSQGIGDGDIYAMRNQWEELTNDEKQEFGRLQERWFNMSNDEQLNLYNEYQAEYEATQEYVFTYTSQFYLRNPYDQQRIGPVHPIAEMGGSSAASPFECLDDALANFPNLRALEHGSNYRCTFWVTKWCWLFFRASGFLLEDRMLHNQEMEALQLSYVLRALGWANTLNRNIKSISLVLESASVWDADSLSYLWREDRNPYAMLPYSPLDPDFSPSRYQSQVDNEHLQQQLIMENAFENITDLNLVLSVLEFDADREVGSAIAEPLFNYLGRPRELRRLNLAFGRIDTGCKNIIVDPRVSNRGAMENLLDLLVRRQPWPKMRDLRLNIAVSPDVLLNFLRSLRQSLRHLALLNMREIYGKIDSETLKREIISSLSIDHLEFS